MSLKILSIGSDRNLFKKDSDAQKRIRDYGKIFEELHIIVFASKELGFSDLKLDGNIFVYPTNHSYKFLYLWNIYKIIKNLKFKIENSQDNFVISCQDPFESGLAGWLLKLWLKIPLQLQIHTDIFSPYFTAESAMNRLRVFMAKFLLPRADGIRVVSERIKQSLITQLLNYHLPIFILPVFIDVKKIQSAKIKINLHEKYQDHDFIILMASRLTQEKNIGMAIEAFAEVIKKLPIKPTIVGSPTLVGANYQLPKNPLLLIVGDGPESESLKFLASRYQLLDSNIIFEPWADDLISYYKTVDLFLLTSNYEGYGRTVIEAMASSLPVIMTDVGLAGELLINDLDGVIIPVMDGGQLEDALVKLIRDNETRQNFAKNSLKAVESFPAKEEYLNLYKKSLEL